MKYVRLACLATALLGSALVVRVSYAASILVSPKVAVTSGQKSPELIQLETEQARTAAAAKEATARVEAEAAAKAKAEQEAKVRAEREAQEKQAAEAAAYNKLLNDAEALIAAGKSAGAYELLLPAEFARSGEIRYDYLLGIAALDSGKADKATLAFERVLAVDHNFAGARLDMARAYFQLGDLARAKIEFNAVLKQDPPEAARTTIQKYLEAINSYEQAKLTRITGYFEETLGRDSNINGATSQAQIPVPAFGNLVFSLNQSSLKTPDVYANSAGGAEINHQINADFGLYAGADVRMRNYAQYYDFKSLDVAARGGLTYNYDDEVFRVGLLGDQYRLGQGFKPNRETLGINAEWRHPAGPSDQLTVFTQYTQNRFVASGMETQDHDLVLVGESWLHVNADGKSVVFGSLFGGRETAVAPITPLNPNGGRPDGNKQMIGLRLGTQITLSDEWDCFAGIGGQLGKYKKENLAFLTSRNDTGWDWNAGMNWRFDKDWTVRPQVSMSSNKSNIPIYSYDRTDISVMLRRDFK